jgi:hypothetical protein
MVAAHQVTRRRRIPVTWMCAEPLRPISRGNTKVVDRA